MIEADPVLGAVVGVYPSDRGRLLVVAGVIGATAALILNFTLGAIRTWWGPLLTVIIMGLIVLALGWYLLHLWNREVILYARGFSYREGSRTVFFQYAEIRSIRQRAEQLAYLGNLIRRRVYRITLTTQQDETIVLNNLYSRVSELSARLEQRIHEALLPLIQQRLAGGERVPFSDTLVVTTDGLQEGGRDLPWRHFSGYKVQQGRLLLLDTSGATWFSILLSEIDNITVLVDLLRQRVRMLSNE